MSEDVLAYKKPAARPDWSRPTKSMFTRSTSSCSYKGLQNANDSHQSTTDVKEKPRINDDIEKLSSGSPQNFDVQYSSCNSRMSTSNFTSQNKIVDQPNAVKSEQKPDPKMEKQQPDANHFDQEMSAIPEQSQSILDDTLVVEVGLPEKQGEVAKQVKQA